MVLLLVHHLLIGFSILLLLTLSAFFSFSEMALASSNIVKVKAKNNKGWDRTIKILENNSYYITSIIIWNNVINIFATSLATFWFSSLLGPSGVAVAFGVMSFIIIIGGEITPKQLASKRPEQGLKFFSKMITLSTAIIKPIALPASKMVDQQSDILLSNDAEIIQAIKQTTEKGVTTRSENELIVNSLKLENTTVRQIMIPTKKVVSIKDSDKRVSIEKTISATKHTRYPILDKDEKVVGIFFTKLYMQNIFTKKRFDISQSSLEAITIPSTTNLSTALVTIKSSRQHMAIIVNQSKAMIGIITLEDIVEELLGEIYDENDIKHGEVYELSSQRYIVKSSTKVSSFFGVSIKTKLPKGILPTMTFKKLILSLTNEPKLVNGPVYYENIIFWVKLEKNSKDSTIEIDIFN